MRKHILVALLVLPLAAVAQAQGQGPGPAPGPKGPPGGFEPGMKMHGGPARQDRGDPARMEPACGSSAPSASPRRSTSTRRRR